MTAHRRKPPRLPDPRAFFEAARTGGSVRSHSLGALRARYARNVPRRLAGLPVSVCVLALVTGCSGGSSKATTSSTLLFPFGVCARSVHPGGIAQVNAAIKRFYEFGGASEAEVECVMHNVGVVTPSTQVPPSTPVRDLSSFRCFGSEARLNSVIVVVQRYLLDHPGALTQR